MEFESIIINGNASVKEAMKQLDKTAEKILFVVDHDDRLVGSLTDGDIRRWILADGSLDERASVVCFKGTYFVERTHDIEEVKAVMFKRKIVYVPVVDANRRIFEFLIWDKLFGGRLKRKMKEPLDVPVAIMAGGKGTRLDPFTRILPKPLIPIGEKTVIELIIDKFLEYKVDHFYISLNDKAKIIKSYFEELDPKYRITYLRESKPLGTSGALKQLEGQIDGDLIVTNCDIIIDADYSEVLQHHKEKGNDITAVASVKNFKIPYGVCEIRNGGSLVSITEKPEYSYLVNTGMYVLKSSVLRYIPDNTFYHITQLISDVRSDGLKVGVFPVSENSWIDTGEWVEYRKALEKLTK